MDIVIVLCCACSNSQQVCPVMDKSIERLLTLHISLVWFSNESAYMLKMVYSMSSVCADDGLYFLLNI